MLRVNPCYSSGEVWGLWLIFPWRINKSALKDFTSFFLFSFFELKDGFVVQDTECEFMWYVSPYLVHFIRNISSKDGNSFLIEVRVYFFICGKRRLVVLMHSWWLMTGVLCDHGILMATYPWLSKAESTESCWELLQQLSVCQMGSFLLTASQLLPSFFWLHSFGPIELHSHLTLQNICAIVHDSLCNFSIKALSTSLSFFISWTLNEKTKRLMWTYLWQAVKHNAY